MNAPILTIFTPTYNRAHTLPRLFDSLVAQTDKNFEWLIIDDGSRDNTGELFDNWLKEHHDFSIRYYKVNNGGKNRAINQGLKLAQGQYFMILDSDDLLTKDAVSFIVENMSQLPANQPFIGLSGKRGELNGTPLGCNPGDYKEEGYTDCSNLDRPKYNLTRDMAEVFITEILQKYEFKVWDGEKFTPEEVVWNQIALDGYKLRWFNKVIYLCEYQQGGLSDSSWRLLRDNPMGYAMMFDQRISMAHDFKSKLNNAIQYGSCCFLAREYQMLGRSKNPILTLALSPISWYVSRNRKKQFQSLIK